MKDIFFDSQVATDCIRILNDKIDTYGQVDLGFFKMLITGEEPKITDCRVGWTERFSEEKNLVPRLMGKSWVFEFTIPEPKEL
jgi:hypothetical protein